MGRRRWPSLRHVRSERKGKNVTEVAERRRPGGEMAKRPLHFIWIVDTSSSMAEGGKIQSLNTAIRESLPEMKKVAQDNPYADVLIRTVAFSSGARWHHGVPTSVEEFKWSDVSPSGITDMGHAFKLVADALKMPPMTDRALPPVLVLLSDGLPTDDWEEGLNELMIQPWGKKAVRIAIAIGTEQTVDYDVLQRFIGHTELKPLSAHNATDLVNYIRWVSTEVLKVASAPSSQQSVGGGTSNVPLPTAIPTPVSSGDSSISADDVW